jgi:hypothetical protein
MEEDLRSMATMAGALFGKTRVTISRQVDVSLSRGRRVHINRMTRDRRIVSTIPHLSRNTVSAHLSFLNTQTTLTTPIFVTTTAERHLAQEMY